MGLLGMHLGSEGQSLMFMVGRDALFSGRVGEWGWQRRWPASADS